MPLSESLIIELDTIDSTNNYAMRIIDADKAQPGLTIVAKSQEAGKGQRGKTWFDAAGHSLLMSIITVPKEVISRQFVFNASIAVAVAGILEQLYKNWNIRIKWPNDIIINDKKAGGILIENVLRGSDWTYSVIGIGLNVNQVNFPTDLPHATSLKKESKNNFDITLLRNNIRDQILTTITNLLPPGPCMQLYNNYLYKRGRKQLFGNANRQWEATILDAHPDGTLEVQLEDGETVFYWHGQVVWEWG
jgi:BirA family biotin operon repressor/biotin-[acetyl-CoA-carboxylase] ligase